jgi:hypothetical protein
MDRKMAWTKTTWRSNDQYLKEGQGAQLKTIKDLDEVHDTKISKPEQEDRGIELIGLCTGALKNYDW